MRNITLLSLLLLALSAYTQPKIELDTKAFDFGTIVTAGTIKKSFVIKNTGNEPLVISRVSTGDGGSFATYPRVPVLPDSTGEIIFHYNSQRIGPFRKTIFIKSNAENSNAAIIRVKGEVIHKATQIDLSKDTVDVGEIPFGSIAKAVFKLKNIGSEKLYIRLLSNCYYEADLFYQRIEPFNQLPIEVNDDAEVIIALRNVYGNTGDFQRKFLLKYNSLDTMTIVVKGRYTNASTKNVIYEDGKILHYEDGQLYKIIRLNYSGDYQNISYHNNGYCEEIRYYSWKSGQVNLTRYFKFGDLIDEVSLDDY